MLNNLDCFIRYIRSIVPASDLTEKTSTQGTGTLPDSQNLSYIKSITKEGTCLFEGWDYTLELDKSSGARGSYNITFNDSDTNYVITYYTGESRAYPDFPNPKQQMPRVAIIQNNTSYQMLGNGTWNSNSRFANFKTVGLNLYVFAKKADYYEIDSKKYYGISGIDRITEELIENISAIGSPAGGSPETNCDRKKDRPFIYPFCDFNIRNVGQVEYDSQYGIWTRSITLEGKYV